MFALGFPTYTTHPVPYATTNPNFHHNPNPNPNPTPTIK